MTIAIIIVALGVAALLFIFLRKKKQASAPPKPVAPVSPNDWRPMLGEAVPGPIKRTPKYRISYIANGFDVVRPKQIDKTVAWLTEQGADHLVGPFIAMANEVAKIPEWIDSAYEFNRNQYLACGGKFASFIADDDPSTMIVEIVATPMWVEFNRSWAGGMALSTDKRTIRCVIIAAGGMTDNPATITIEGPATSHLATFQGYIPYEIGNCLMLRYGYMPKQIPRDEWGSDPPCNPTPK
jgi:hypothetical protein